jgi:hypothetical protein
MCSGWPWYLTFDDESLALAWPGVSVGSDDQLHRLRHLGDVAEVRCRFLLGELGALAVDRHAGDVEILEVEAELAQALVRSGNDPREGPAVELVRAGVIVEIDPVAPHVVAAVPDLGEQRVAQRAGQQRRRAMPRAQE